jgi:transcriptional regulator with GAF, ATPase, and Fis domain
VIHAADICADDAPNALPDFPQTISLPIIPAANLSCGEHNPGDCCMAVVDGHWRTMEEVEREHIRRTLVLSGWNQSAAARVLDMERHQLARKIRKYGLHADFSQQGASKRAA